RPRPHRFSRGAGPDPFGRRPPLHPAAQARRSDVTLLVPGHDTTDTVDPRDPLLRLEMLFDPGTTAPLHPRDDSGVLAATGEIAGVRTVAFCTDGTVKGGAMGVAGCGHIVDAYAVALAEQAPIVGLWHSGGARLAEGVEALHAVGAVFQSMITA